MVILSILKPLLAGLVVLLPLTTIGKLFYAAFRQARRMHQIPCHSCDYASGDLRLKCALHPKVALSEASIGCSDYKPARFS